MINLRIGRQTFDFDCGVNALQTVMSYYGVEARADELIQEMGTDWEEGTPIENMIKAAEKRGFRVYADEEWDLEKLKRFVDAGHPVIVLLQAWAERYMTLEDWRNDKDDGHYASVIQYENGIIVFEDPSSFRRTWLNEEEFLARWHDYDTRIEKRIQRFGMVLLGKEPAPTTPQKMG